MAQNFFPPERDLLLEPPAIAPFEEKFNRR
jgi:hypothetical protein